MHFKVVLFFGSLIGLGVSVWYFMPRTEGTISFISTNGNTQTERIKDCFAGLGSRPTLFGIHLVTTHGIDVFLHDGKLVPTEPTHLQVHRSDEDSIDIDPKDCSKLVTSLSWGEGNIYTDVKNHANGNISAQCRLSDGSRMQVEASFRECTLK